MQRKTASVCRPKANIFPCLIQRNEQLANFFLQHIHWFQMNVTAGTIYLFYFPVCNFSKWRTVECKTVQLKCWNVLMQTKQQCKLDKLSPNLNRDNNTKIMVPDTHFTHSWQCQHRSVIGTWTKWFLVLLQSSCCHRAESGSVKAFPRVPTSNERIQRE